MTQCLVLLRSVFRSEFRSRLSMTQRLVFLRSVFRSEFPSRTSLTQTCRLFLRSVFRSEFRSQSTMLNGALQALQLPRQQLRSARMTGFFALFPKGKKVRGQGASRVRTWRRTPAHPRRKPMTLPIPTDGSKSNFGAPGGPTGGTGSTVLVVEGAAGAVHLHVQRLGQGGTGLLLTFTYGWPCLL